MRVLRIGSIFILVLIVAVGLLFVTEKGHEIRRMIAGSILSSQHPQYASLLLPKNELEELTEAIYHPPNRRSDIPRLPFRGKTRGPLTEILTYETPHFLAKVIKVNDPRTIHLIGTKDPDHGQPLSELMTEHGAVAGINGGGFFDPAGKGTGGIPLGIAIGDGKVLSMPEFPHNKPQLVCGFTKLGQFFTGTYSINGLLSMGATQAVQFGPQLLVDGKNMVTPTVDAAYGWAPRTAIGQDANGAVYLVGTDGRFYADKRHRGASMQDIVELFQHYGVVDAFNLDGGGSTTIMSGDQLLIKPATHTRVGMRYLPNAFVVIPRGPKAFTINNVIRTILE